MQNNISLLDQFSTDLTAMAQEGKLAPIIGHNDELNQLVEALSMNNSVVLVGDRDLGTSEIVEGLAQLITSGNVPELLFNIHVRQLDLGSLSIRAWHPGFSRQLEQFLEQASASNSILYIDDLSIVITLGNQTPYFNLEMLLQTSGGLRKLRWIGVSSPSSYEDWQRRDPVLSACFESIYIHEPSTEEAIEILRGMKKPYENHHQMEISDQVIEAAVRLSVKYVRDRKLPGIALDLIDEAMSRIRLSNATNSMNTSNSLSPKRNDLRLTAKDIAEVVALWTKLPLDDIN